MLAWLNQWTLPGTISFLPSTIKSHMHAMVKIVCHMWLLSLDEKNILLEKSLYIFVQVDVLCPCQQFFTHVGMIFLSSWVEPVIP